MTLKFSVRDSKTTNPWDNLEGLEGLEWWLSTNGSETDTILPSMQHFAMSGDIFSYQN